MGRPPKRRDLGVYDFNEEEEAVEKSQMARSEKWRASPRDDDSPVDKIKFLKVFAPVTNLSETGRTGLSVDVGDRNGEREMHMQDSYRISLPEVNEVDPTDTSDVESPISSGSKQSDDPLDEDSGKKSPESSREDLLGEGTSRMNTISTSRNGPDWDHLDPPINVKQQALNSDDEDDCTVSSSCHTDQSINEDSKDQVGAVDSWCTFKVLEDANTPVILSPDYVLYKDKSYADCRLIFLPDCIRMECFVAHGIDETFNFEWAVENLIHIDYLWSQSVETVWVEVQSKPADEIGNNEVHGGHGYVTLIFTVIGREWFCYEQKILSLASRYKDIWKVKPTSRNAIFPENFAGMNTIFASRYLTDFEGAFEDVVYPEGDPDAVSISRRDIELLQPEVFINDTIIDFYIKYLKKKLKPEENNRFHFFNSFFFRKLADMDKDPPNRLEGREAFLRVRKWTRKVNIFEKDYLFIPVNFNLHWSLLIVCHPGEIAYFEEKNKGDTLKLPCILHLDSLRGSHSGLKHPIQSYLWEEWKERHPESPTDTSFIFLNLRFISLELPQQENMSDCGLFLLHYVELFLKQAPVTFSIFSITNLSNFLSPEWFVPAEASFKRFLIRNLLYDLLCHASQNGTFSCSDEEFPNECLLKGQSAELLQSHCHGVSSELDNGDRSVNDRGIKLELCTRSPNSAQSANDDGLVGRQFFVSESTTRPCLDRHKHFFQGSFKKGRCALSPIEEDGEQDVYLDTKEILQPLSHATSTSYPCRDFSALDMLHTVSVQEEKNEDGNLSFETLRIGSQDLIKKFSSENSVNDCNCLPDNRALVSVKNEEADSLRSHSLGNCDCSHNNTAGSSSEEMLNTCSVGDTQEISACLVNLNNEGNNVMPKLQEKLEDTQERLGVSLSQGTLETCIVEDSQGVDTDEETEKTKTVSTENEDVPGSPASVGMLETCTIRDSQGVDANREMLKSESDLLDKHEDVQERSRTSNSLEMETCLAKDFQEGIKPEKNDNDGSFHSCQEERHLDLPCQDVGTSEICNVDPLGDDVQTKSSDMTTPVHQPHKRRKFQRTESGRMRTRSVSRNTSL